MFLAAMIDHQINQGLIDHEFRYVANEEWKSVYVAGTFNGWDKSRTALSLGPDGHTWRATVMIPYGAHQYKFVLNGDKWITDPGNPRSQDDGNGNINSILVILPPDFGIPASPQDGVIATSVLKHEMNLPDLNFDQNKLSFRLTLRKGDCKSVKVVTKSGESAPLSVLKRDELTETVTAAIPWNRRGDLLYHFVLTDGAKTYSFGPKGLTSSDAGNWYVLRAANFRPFSPPSWAQSSVFYQIFPDRFANCSKANDPKTMAAWTDAPKYFNRYGGDIAGVRQHLDYLNGLGINGVYFNPVMAAPSNHRYDPADYYRIDPEFGTNAEFARLASDLHSRNIRVVLDQIFDHCGTTFGPFADLLQFQKESRYQDWFTVKSWPVQVQEDPPYVAWFGFPSMPKLNLSNPATKDYLFGSVDYWMQYAKLDGWRLDVANEVPQPFWREFRTRVKANNPQAWIIGEEWGDANAWLKGDQWDASMNYPFRFAVLNGIAKGQGSASQLVESLLNNYRMYAPQVSRAQLNMLSSHDTARFITEAGGNAKRAALGAYVQFTWPGTPSIYYGEELGMLGGADPENRRGMEWNRVTRQNELLPVYSKLAYLKTHLPVLALGEPEALPGDDSQNVAAYGRRTNNDFLVVLLNRGGKAARLNLTVPQDHRSHTFLNCMSGISIKPTKGRIQIEIPPLNAKVLVLSTPQNRRIVEDAGRSTNRFLTTLRSQS